MESVSPIILGLCVCLASANEWQPLARSDARAPDAVYVLIVYAPAVHADIYYVYVT